MTKSFFFKVEYPFKYCPGSIWFLTIMHCLGSVNSQGPPKDPHNSSQQRRAFQSNFSERVAYNSETWQAILLVKKADVAVSTLHICLFNCLFLSLASQKTPLISGNISMNISMWPRKSIHSKRPYRSSLLLVFCCYCPVAYNTAVL